MVCVDYKTLRYAIGWQYQWPSDGAMENNHLAVILGSSLGLTSCIARLQSDSDSKDDSSDSASLLLDTSALSTIAPGAQHLQAQYSPIAVSNTPWIRVHPGGIIVCWMSEGQV